jgi:hypothetical protein
MLNQTITQPQASPLIKAESVIRLGLTVTQVFYIVGQQAEKKLCRFVKTDRLKDAFSTLLAIKGKRQKVEYLRIGEFKGSVRVFTAQEEVYIPSAEASAFLTRYNQLATSGCISECHCQDVWRHLCVHRIAEHLTSVQDKLAIVIQAAKQNIKYPDVLAKLTELQIAAKRLNLSIPASNIISYPFSAEVFNNNGEKLGWMILSPITGQTWVAKLVEGTQEIVASALEGLIILKEPQQLTLEF